MRTEDAKRIVRDIFQKPFDKDRFVYFIKNLLNEIDESKAFHVRGYVPEIFKNFVKTYERIGTYTDPDGKRLDVMIVYLQKESTLERARTAQRNFIARYLKDRGEKDGGLVAFVSPGNSDWRFSLVKMEYKLAQTAKGNVVGKEEFTPAKRYSFIVGVNESSHTAQRSLVPIIADDEHNPTLNSVESAFNIEKVTKEFFNKYRELFHRLNEAVETVVKEDDIVRRDFEEKGVNPVDFAKKLLGQIVFLYFLQKKGWFGVERKSDWGSGSKQFLRELFEKKHGEYTNFFNDILEPLFYEALRLERPGDYYSRFDCRIPFLNGGLFDPINDYNWWDTDILIPNDMFSNHTRTPEGDIGNGIFDVFDRYNFTVKEDEPLEKEVAVDPEMLGKVFENLLAVQDRKSKGTYYTPREIVHYMCQESLASYLATELEGKVIKEDTETLIKYGEAVVEHDSRVVNEGRETERYSFKLPQSVRDHAELIDDKLASIRVCDPAVGSGAFPVGMMNEIVRARNTLTSYIGINGKRSPYNFKRQAIQHCLYGVDIDPGAVEIAKLRLWLSLVVDEEDRETIQPLPNLDYKIVQGNSLLSVEKNLFNAAQFRKLEELKPLFFNEASASKKQKYRDQIDELISQITNGHKDFDFEVYFSEVFHEKKGFDVVIANPPYIEHKKLKSINNQLKRFYVYSGTADLYVYFFEVALNILRNEGMLMFISSNKFIRARYGSHLRELLAKNRIKNIVDFTEVQIFDALVASCIVSVLKKMPEADVSVSFVDDTFSDKLSDYVANNHITVPASSLDGCIWQLKDTANLKIKKRIEAGSSIFKEVDGLHIFRGITTGYNPAFIISGNLKDKLIAESEKNKEIIKPLLQGRNIKKWFYKSSDEYLLFIPWHFPLHLNQNISGVSMEAESLFKSNYSTLYDHITQFKKQLSQRNVEETGIRYEWYALQRCAASYYPEFEKEKIIWGLTADKWAFAYDNKNHYLPSNGYILTSSLVSVKYLLALMNSKLMQFYFGFVGIMTAGGAFTLKHETIASFPIKVVMKNEQKPFNDLVGRILIITSDDDYSENPTKQAKVREYEKQIDQLVYKLYGLTQEEIRIIEKQ